MTEHEASRTLVKSPPELWAELSDEGSLAGHLAEPFGEIRITRLEPETTVAWEGERASGTVRIEPSGWGTRVTLTARAARAQSPAPEERPEPPDPEPEPPPAPKPEPLPPAAAEPLPPAAAEPHPAVMSEAPPRGLRGRLLGWLRTNPVAPAPALALAPAAPAPAAMPKAPPAPRPASATSKAPEPEPTPAMDPDAVLMGVLDSLGAAHHRPFSRS
ncbi:MAG TPA: hypothetical protein VG275_06740 [Solirubrobacteraceae bacterium]|nr:hypothetical protein [Solirubrobacteraceae bacterium]